MLARETPGCTGDDFKAGITRREKAASEAGTSGKLKKKRP